MSNLFLVPLGVALGDSRPLAAIEELNAERLVRFRSFGYDQFRQCRTSVFELCYDAMTAFGRFAEAPHDIDALFYAIEPSVNSSNNWMQNTPTWMQKDIRWLIQSLKLEPRRIVGLSFYNCATFLSALDLAAALFAAGADASLVVIGGAANVHSPRVPHNFHIQSDGAVAFFLTRKRPRSPAYHLVAYELRVINPSAFRSLSGEVNDTSYFAMKALDLRETIDQLFDKAGVARADIGHLFVQNIGVASMRKYAALCGVNEEALWLDSLAPNAHIIGVDTLVSLFEHHRAYEGRSAGKYVLALATSGMSWGGVILESVK